ncbi:hypothetical protein ACFLWO_02600 [Chloroflexota bacterium]
MNGEDVFILSTFAIILAITLTFEYLWLKERKRRKYLEYQTHYAEDNIIKDA